MLSIGRSLALGADSCFGSCVLASAGTSRRQALTAIALFGFWDALGSLAGGFLHQADWHNCISRVSSGAAAAVVGVSVVVILLGLRRQEHILNQLGLEYILPPLFSLDNLVAGIAYPHSQLGLYGDALMLGACSALMSLCGFLAGSAFAKAKSFARLANPVLIVSALSLLIWTVSH